MTTPDVARAVAWLRERGRRPDLPVGIFDAASILAEYAAAVVKEERGRVEAALWKLEHDPAPPDEVRNAYWWGRGVNDAVAAVRRAES